MLGKLFKLEFASTYRKMCIMYIVAVAVSAITYVGSYISVTHVGLSGSFLFSVLTGTLSVIFAVCMIALICISFFLAYASFYRSMYTSRGYLTHTLPVDPVMTFGVKTVVSFIWVIASVLLFIVCGFVQMAGKSGHAPFYGIVKLFTRGHELAPILGSIVSLPFGAAVTVLIILAVMIILNLLLIVFTSMSIGQLSPDSKGRNAVSACISIYMLEDFLEVALLVVTVLCRYDSEPGAVTEEQMNEMMPGTMSTLLIATLIAITVYNVVMIAVNCRILKKKINLQ